ncbi:MAG: hypothetical protein ACHQNT_05820 [Bacteroidia bacterium]
MPIIEEHPVIFPPKSNVSLWRYMDIPSFLSLLIDKSLTFVRADLLEDKYEGTLPTLTAAIIDFQYKNLSELLKTHNNTATYLNCWCKESHEMVHMWKIYSKENGIAIETKYEDLKAAVESNEAIYATEVMYIDFHKEIINWQANAMTVYTMKRQEYKSENEVRLILSHPKVIEDQLLHLKPFERNDARQELCLKNQVIKCKVNLAKLISKIHISPYAPKWYFDIVNDVTKIYLLTAKEIIQSDL